MRFVDKRPSEKNPRWICAFQLHCFNAIGMCMKQRMVKPLAYWSLTLSPRRRFCQLFATELDKTFLWITELPEKGICPSTRSILNLRQGKLGLRFVKFRDHTDKCQAYCLSVSRHKTPFILNGLQRQAIESPDLWREAFQVYKLLCIFRNIHNFAWFSTLF